MKPPRNAQADHAVDFLNNLTLTEDYLGQPFHLRPFQERIIRNLFGRLDPEGRRIVNKVLLLLPRKCGKTYLAAAIVIYFLLGLPDCGQQILSAANSREQAARLFETARQILEADPYLHSLVEIIPSTKRIVVPHKASFYVALSSEGKNALSWNPSVVIVDEFQEFNTDRSKRLYHNLVTGRGARKNPLTIHIMTGGHDRNSLGYEEMEYAKKVEQGIIKNPHYLPILYYAKEEDDWTSEAVWRRVCPALGDYVSLDFFRQECELAKQLPSREAVFRQFYLNQFVRSSDKQWVADEAWMRNTTAPLADATKVRYTAGLDIASVEDTSALVLYGKRPDGKFDVIPHYWIADDQKTKRKGNDFNYPAWVSAGLIRTTPGEAQDQEAILHDSLEILHRYGVSHIAVDRWGAHWMANKLLDAGLKVEYFGQGYQSQTEPIKKLQRQILAGLLAHGGHEVMRWNISNCRVEIDRTESYRLSKDKSREKVDGANALISACGIYQEQQSRSVYDERPSFVVI